MPGADSRPELPESQRPKPEQFPSGVRQPREAVDTVPGSETFPQGNKFLKRVLDFMLEHKIIDPPWCFPTREEVARRGEILERSVSYTDALTFAQVRNAIADEKDIIVSGGELLTFKNILRRAGIPEKEIAKMSPSEIIVASQLAFPRLYVLPPADVDFKGKILRGEPLTRARRRAAEVAGQQEIKSARSLDEEILTPEKVAKHLTVAEEDFGKESKTGGPGAMEVRNWYDDLPPVATSLPELGRYIRQIQNVGREPRNLQVEYRRLHEVELALDRAVLAGEIEETDVNLRQVRRVLGDRINVLLQGQAEGFGRIEPAFEEPAKENIDRLINLAKDGTTSGDAWSAALEKVQQDMAQVQALADAEEPSNYRQAFYINKAIKDSLLVNRKVIDRLPDDVRAQLETFINRQEGPLAKLDQKFRKELDDMDTDERTKLIGDISRDALIYFQQIVSGFGVTSPDEARQILEDHIREDPTGIREWRVMVAIQRLEDAVRVHQLFVPPDDWRDTPEQLSHIYAFMEGTDFSVEELSATVQEAIAMVRRIPPDIPEGRQLREHLVKELDAFRAFHSLRITLERNDMDPREFLPLFRQHFDDETWVHFVNRFSRDERYRSFFIPQTDKKGRYLDAEGKPTTDIANAAAHENVNPLDISFELYSEQLRQDRIRMDIVEEITKCAIGKKLDKNTLRQIQMGVGLRDRNGKISKFFPMSEAEFNAEVERIRVDIVDRMKLKIRDKNDPDYKALRGLSVDEVWGRKKTIEIDGREVQFLNTTAEIIRNWYAKKTLQGAFGLVTDPEEARRQGRRTDIDELMEEFQITDRKVASKRFEGKSFLKIRREQILEGLVSRLNGLKVNSGDEENPDFKAVNLDKLLESGFLESVDSNAYYFAWTMEWSTYDSIRIYSRDSKSELRDDYDHLVFHQSTNLFFGRQIDQTWEFLHEQNENRGRSKENDVNRIWKQFMPGKHSWLFPSNGIATRWAQFFMTPEQKAEVARRTKKYMQEWDFDNVKYHSEFFDWMSGIVVRDMIESGEIAFGRGSKKLSDAANEVKLRKFEFIDVFTDRSKHIQFTNPEIFQDYLADPTEGKFIDINNKVKSYYSTRDARQFPWMTSAFRAHWEIASKHKQRLFDQQNLSSPAAEMVIDGLVGSGNMEREQGVKEKRKWLGFNELQIGGTWHIPKLGTLRLGKREVALGDFNIIPKLGTVKLGEFFGTTPFRWARRKMEEARRMGYDSKLLLFAAFWAGFWAGVLELVKQFPSQLAQQTQGR